MLQVQGKSLLVSHHRGDEIVIFLILGPLGDFSLIMRCLHRESIYIKRKGGLSLVCHLNPFGGVHWALGRVGRVATGPIYHLLVLHFKKHVFVLASQ